jgi:hypothetical protein
MGRAGTAGRIEGARKIAVLRANGIGDFIFSQGNGCTQIL